MVQTHPRKLLVVISEAVIERQLVADARSLGALGYTVVDVRGGGAHVSVHPGAPRRGAGFARA